MLNKKAPSGVPNYSVSASKDIFKIITNISKYAIKNKYNYIENSILEYDEILNDKTSENGKIRYKLKTSRKEDSELALRFDNTRGFMRWCADNCEDPEIKKFNGLFKRFYIGKVFRGERPQKGRAKEFYQADFDIVSKDIFENKKLELIELLCDIVCKIFNIKDITIKLNKPNLKIGRYLTEFDDSQVRGQDYYTGLTFEVEYKNKSIIAGGEYEIPYDRFNVKGKNPKAFGGSIGITRLLDLLN